MSITDEEGPAESLDPDSAATSAEEEQIAWVGEMATVRDGIDLNSDNVIGIFGKPSDLHALLRQPDGQILKVKVGDAALGGRVHGINEDSVVIIRHGKITLLRIPSRKLDWLASFLQ